MDDITIYPNTVITQERVEDLLCGAFEGGSNYWACTGVTKKQREEVGAEFSFEVATRGGEIEVFDAEEPDEKLGVINEERIKKAFRMMREGKNEKGESKPHYTEHLRDFLNFNDDANTSDIFFQLAVMGDIVFG